MGGLGIGEWCKGFEMRLGCGKSGIHLWKSEYVIRMCSYERIHVQLSSLKINKTRTAHRTFSSNIRDLRLRTHIPTSSNCMTRPRRRESDHKWVLRSNNSKTSRSTRVWASRNGRQGLGVKCCSALVIWHPLSRIHTSYGCCALAFMREGRNIEGGLKAALIKSTTPENSRRYLCQDRGPIRL